jgi:sugar/nucleoside kinase (ribokinase family)
MLVSGISGERTILWQQAPTITRGDRIDIGLLFAADLTIVDCVEMDLRRFLTDLPAHTQPGARLLGTLTYLAEVVAHDKLEVALRHDILVGNEREYCALAGDDDPMRALERIAAAMPGSNLRVAVMTQGRRGSVAVSRAGRWCASARSVTVRDTTGAGDAFAGAFAYAQARRWEIERSLAFANATASFVVGALGAQTSLPSLEQVLATLDGDTR